MKTVIPSRLSPGLRSPRSPRSPRIPRPNKTLSSSKLLNSMLDTEERLDRVIAEMPQEEPENKEKVH